MAAFEEASPRNGRRAVLTGMPTGDCVTEAVRPARFPRFKGAPMMVIYPFVIE